MQVTTATAAAATAMATLMLGLGPAAPAGASGEHALNGTFAVTSLGDWAKTRDVYMDEPTVRSTWTISSSCDTPISCTGTVSSDQGWTEPVKMGSGEVWRIDRDLENWVPCPDGTSAPGHQIYMFYPVDEAGFVKTGSPVFAGYDKTMGPSGACGINNRQRIEMPLKLVRIT